MKNKWDICMCTLYNIKSQGIWLTSFCLSQWTSLMWEHATIIKNNFCQVSDVLSYVLSATEKAYISQSLTTKG